MKYTLMIIGLLSLLLAVLAGSKFLKAVDSKSQPDHPHFHAGFKIYINGVLQDYSSEQYMKLENCSVDSTTQTQEDRVHLHNGIGNVAHVHADGARWKELFTYLKINLDPETKVFAFINGNPANDVIEQLIHPYDSLVLFIGDTPDPNQYQNSQVTRDEIVQAEKTLENCGSNS